MFRLTAYGDQPELYRYLSSIASNSIGQALDDWFGTPYELEEVYLDYFTSRIGVNRMSMDDAEEAGYESLFFWDDDCLLFFDGDEYFIDSIHQITSGAGAAMGYGYEDVTKIFTDAGYQLPLWLVGTKAAYDAREESLRERLKNLQDQIYPEQDSPEPE